MRLIDAENLWLTTEYVDGKEHKYYEQFEVDDAPTIDAQPVRHAKIVNIPFGDSTYEGCSLCGADYNRYYSHGNYCSYCGAKFDEVDEE